MQNWNQWQLPAGGITTPIPQPPVGYATPGADPMAMMQAYMQYYNQPAPNGYTAEQWAAAQQQNWAQWQQWQQQYQQWQAQYGDKYQETMKHLSAQGMGLPIQAPPLPAVQPPPPLPKDDAKPPLPPTTYQFTSMPPPHQNNLPLFPAKQSAPQATPTNYPQNPPLPSTQPPLPPDAPESKDDGPAAKRAGAGGVSESSGAKKLKVEDDELSEAERTFDAQFKQWEEQFNTWKQQNANHPDKDQYKQYEAKWTSWREKLIERREQMRKKREQQKQQAAARAETEKRDKPLPEGDKIMNILSSTENQGLINNLLGIGKTLGLTGKQSNGALVPPPPPPAQAAPGSQNQSVNQSVNQSSSQLAQQTAGSQVTSSTNPNMAAGGWQAAAGSPWPMQYNAGGFPGFQNVARLPTPMFGAQQSQISQPNFAQPPPSMSNATPNFSQPPPGFLANDSSHHAGRLGPPNMQERPPFGSHLDKIVGMPETSGQGNYGPNDGPMGSQKAPMGLGPESFGARDGGQYRGNDSFAPRSEPFARDGDARRNEAADQFRRDDRGYGEQGKSQFNAQKSGAFNQSNDRFGHANDRFASTGSRFPPGGGDRFAPDNERFRAGDRFGPAGERFGPTGERFASDSDRFGPANDRHGPPGRFAPDSDRFGPAANRFAPGNDRFGPGNDRFGPAGDRFGGGDDRFAAGGEQQLDRFRRNSMDPFEQKDGPDRRDGFVGNSRGFGRPNQYEPPDELAPELKKLMEKRRAAMDVFKPSFLDPDRSNVGSLSESFKKIAGDSPFMSRNSNEAFQRDFGGPKGSPVNFGPRGPLNFGSPGPGGPKIGDFRPRGPGDFRPPEFANFRPPPNAFSRGENEPRASEFEPRRDPDCTETKNGSSAVEVRATVDSSIVDKLVAETTVENKDATVADKQEEQKPLGGQEGSGDVKSEHVSEAFVSPAGAASKDAAQPLNPEASKDEKVSSTGNEGAKKADALPFMGENDPKPEDLNMEPPPELPNLGPVPSDLGQRDAQAKSDASGRRFPVFGPRGAEGGPFANSGPGLLGPNVAQLGQFGPRGPNDRSFGLDRCKDAPFDNRSMDGQFSRREGPFGPSSGPDERFFGRRPKTNDSPLEMRNTEGPFGSRGLGDRSFGPRGVHDGPFGTRGPNDNSFAPQGPNDGSFGPRGPCNDGPFGSRGSNDGPFGPRGPSDSPFGPRGPVEPPFGRRGANDPPFGPRGPNDHPFGPRGPNDGPFGPRGPNIGSFGPRNPVDAPFKARGLVGPDGPFGSRRSDDSSFGPRGPPDGQLTGRSLRDSFGPRGFNERSSDPHYAPGDPGDRQFRAPFTSRGPNGDEFANRPPFGPGDSSQRQPFDANVAAKPGIQPLMSFKFDGPKPSDFRDKNPEADVAEVGQFAPGEARKPERKLYTQSSYEYAERRGDRPSAGKMNVSGDSKPDRGVDPTLSSSTGEFRASVDGEHAKFTGPNASAKRPAPTRTPTKDFCIEKQFNYNHGGGPDKKFVEHVPAKVIDYAHVSRPIAQDYLSLAQCFDYAHGSLKPLAPDHYREGQKRDSGHWLENEQTLKDYAERSKRYESPAARRELRRPPPGLLRGDREDRRFDRDRRECDGYRDRERDYDDRRREYGSDKGLDERSKRDGGRCLEKAQERCERSRREAVKEKEKDDERSKGSVSWQEKSSKSAVEKKSQDVSVADKQHDGSDGPPKTMELAKTPNCTMVDDLLCPPGRQTRPPKIAIILRGPPGSGKSFVAKLIKDKEVEQGGSAPRILSLDDYFLIEKEVETVDDNGKKLTVKDMVYEYEEAMEPSYIASLAKAFKKNITDGFFNFIILDCINEKISDYEDMWSFAKTKGFKVYVCEMEMDAQICLKRNIHNRSEDEINRIIDYFEPTPGYHQKLDVNSMLQEQAIEEVHMEDSEQEQEKAPQPNEDSLDSQEDAQDPAGVSKWERMEAEDKLDRLDGLAKRKNEGKPQTMEDFLQVPDYYNMEDTSGKKRVRWADLEERKEQEKMRAVGFVVGHTNWDRMMDPTKGGSALTRTKFFSLT